jgi:hypothetical protein
LIPVLRVFYNLFFHPLRKFPGPLLWRASIIPSMNALARGKLAHAVAGLHEQYGHVVRIAPNEISFTEPHAWKDICGHRIGANKGNEEIGKYQLFYQCLEARARPIAPPAGAWLLRSHHARTGT